MSIQSHSFHRVFRLVLLFVFLMLFAGCTTSGQITAGTEPRAYPYDAPILDPVDVMVDRDGATVLLVNHTTHSYQDFDLWLNERYLRRIELLSTGGSMSLSLFEFVDEYGDPFKAGGLLATRKPDALVKAEIETGEGLVGLIVVSEQKR